MESRWVPVAALVVLAIARPAGSAHGQPVDAPQPAPARSVLAFNPNPPDRCEWFFITESSISYTPIDLGNSYDQYLVNDSFGLMKHVGSRTTVGASMDFIFAQNEIHYAPTVRCKRWYGKQSVDLMLGYVPGEKAGPAGPILTARYSPARLFHMQIGACRYNELGYPSVYDRNSPVVKRRPLRVFAGIGFGGVPGVTLWGVQAGLLAAAAAAYASSF